MKYFPKTFILICVAFAFVLPLIAENLYDVVDDAEKAIIQKYPNESSIAHRLAKKELEDIVFSDKTEEEKIAAIRAKYPAISGLDDLPGPYLPIPTEFAQSSNPAQLIFRPPLQWTIQSIEIAYDLDSVTNVLLSAESLYREEDSKSSDDSIGGSTNRSINAGAKTRLDLDVNGSVGKPEKGAWNPLNWFQAKAGFDWVTSGYAGIDYTNTKNTQWNERAQRALSNQYEEKASILRNDRISGRHLTFYILFKNNTDKELRFNPKNFEIPVYAGENQPVATAKVDTDLQLFRIPRNGYADLKFRAELNTTSAVNLIGYMRSNEPQIRLDRAQSVIVSSDGSIQDAVQESIQVPTVPFRCRDLELQIRKNNQGRTTTVADAMQAINAVFEKAPFEFNENGECVSLVGVPLVKNGSNDWNINQIPVIGINGNFTSGVIPAVQLNRPIAENGLLVDVVDLFDRDTWDNVSSQLQAYMIQPLKIAAESGNAIAQNRLGLCYDEEKGVSKNVYEAARWYRMAADQGMVAAQSNLGLLYYFNENYTEAIPWLRKAAEQGNSSAQFWLAACYENGYGVNKNIDEAGRWFWMAANQDNIYAQSSLGRLYYQHKEYSEAVFWFRKAAEQGDQYAQNYLGLCYDNGYGVNKNTDEAAKWYRKAAEQGLAAAQSNLGLLYYLDKNYFEAVPWFRKAAVQGIRDAQNFLGLCYNNGYGVSKNTEEAAKWYRKAAEQGLAAAQSNLGQRYYLDKNYYEAVPWFRKAAEQGDANGQCLLGMCYDLGHGVREDKTEAAKWYRKAAEQGLAGAQNCLGNCYFSGDGVYQDYYEAAKWYRMAAEQGHVSAQVNLAACYSTGWGVQKNESEAVKWYRKAADQGNERAKQSLKQLGY
jgi:hypothetical protein